MYPKTNSHTVDPQNNEYVMILKFYNHMRFIDRLKTNFAWINFNDNFFFINVILWCSTSVCNKFLKKILMFTDFLVKKLYFQQTNTYAHTHRHTCTCAWIQRKRKTETDITFYNKCSIIVSGLVFIF